MKEKNDYLEKYRELLDRIDFTIPNNTSSKYYLNAVQAMLEKGCSAAFEPNRVVVWGEEGNLFNGIQSIDVFFGTMTGKLGLIFKIKINKEDTGMIIDNLIEANSVKKGILSEREQLSFSLNNEFYRYDYLREYEMDGTCIYHSSKDLSQKLSSSAKLYDKGILISLFDVKNNLHKSIVLLGNYVGEKRKHASFEIKKGRIFDEINSPDAKEVPYKPYPFSNAEFEKILLRV